MPNKDFGVKKVNVISSNNISGINYKAVGTGATVRTLESKLGDIVSVKDFGAVGDGVEDDLIPLQNAIAAATATATDSDLFWPVVDLGGLTYGVSDTLILDTNDKVTLSNGTIKAIGTWTSGKHVVDVKSNNNPRFIRIKIDGSFQAGCLKATKRVRLLDVDLVRFSAYNISTPTYGLWNEGGVNSTRLSVAQWKRSDVGYDVQANRTGIGIYTNHADSQFLDTVTSWSMIPLLIGSSSLFNRFVQLHVFNGSGSSAEIHTDPINIVVEQGAGKTSINSLYCDNGFIDLYSRNVAITNTIFLYNTSRATLTSHIRFFAVQNNDTISRFQFTNYLADTGLKLFDFINNGFSWASNTTSLDTLQSGVLFEGSNTSYVYNGNTNTGSVQHLVSSNDNALHAYEGINTTNLIQSGAIGNDYGIRTNGTTRLTVESNTGSLNGLGNEVYNYRLRRYNINVSSDIDTAYSFALVQSDTAVAITFTLDNTAKSGTTVKFIQKGAGTMSLTPKTGATLLGNTTTRTLTRYMACTATVYRNSDNESAEWTLEGTFT